MENRGEYLSWILEKYTSRRRYLKDYRKHLERLKCLDLDAEIWVFGSIVEGSWVPSSDIDVLLISDRAPQDLESRAQLLIRIHRELGDGNPFQIHLITRSQLDWYLKQIKSFLRI